MNKRPSLSLLIVLAVTGIASAIGGPFVGVSAFFGIVLISAIIVGGRSEKRSLAAQRA
ncbi:MULTISPECIES: hypothetical protein [unclassified Ruegeria]|uniref:hypothetical protein n=1 Tax=unclassified Ruegeria TaxID=2625375 RepID=UPI0014888880|nr:MULTISPECIES: hypothetical protein [unclassified Ruegeria]